jgi:hypothetical protein
MVDHKLPKQKRRRRFGDLRRLNGLNIIAAASVRQSTKTNKRNIGCWRRGSPACGSQFQNSKVGPAVKRDGGGQIIPAGG